MSNDIIRDYKPTDRLAVRRICGDTADKGGPVENFFPDRDCIVDVLCAYYTDYEPQSLFVAEHENQVVGYVMSCMDNRRYGLAMIFIIIPKALLKAFVRGVLFKSQFWRLLGGTMQNWPRLFAWRKKSFHSHTGHVHLGIFKEFRSRHLGTQLLDQILVYAKKHHIESLCASVHDGNEKAARFFEKHQFTKVEKNPMVMYYAGKLVKYHSLLYVKKI